MMWSGRGMRVKTKMEKSLCCAFLLLTWVAQTHSFSSSGSMLLSASQSSRRAATCGVGAARFRMRVGGDAFDDGPVSDEGNQKRTNRRSRTDPEELRAAFKLAWDNRFQGTGKEVSAPDVDEMMAEELCPEIVKETLSKFIVDEDLKLVNQAKIKMVELSLEAAIREEDYDEAARLRDERARLRARDPMYAHGDLVKQFREEEKKQADGGASMRAAGLRAASIAASKFLPQYQLEGRWRGHYGQAGWEQIQVKYEGDTLIATKLTGDQNVPAGVVTFKADVSEEGRLEYVDTDAAHPAEKIRQHLESNLGGTLSYKGEGMVAAPGFTKSMFVPGQLMTFPEQNIFGFLWLPLGRMIMFEYLGEENEEGDAVEGVVSGQGSADTEVAEGTLRIGKSDESGTEGGEHKEVPPPVE